MKKVSNRQEIVIVFLPVGQFAFIDQVSFASSLVPCFATAATITGAVVTVCSRPGSFAVGRERLRHCLQPPQESTGVVCCFDFTSSASSCLQVQASIGLKMITSTAIDVTAFDGVVELALAWLISQPYFAKQLAAFRSPLLARKAHLGFDFKCSST